MKERQRVTQIKPQNALSNQQLKQSQKQPLPAPATTWPIVYAATSPLSLSLSLLTRLPANSQCNLLCSLGICKYTLKTQSCQVPTVIEAECFYIHYSDQKRNARRAEMNTSTVQRTKIHLHTPTQLNVGKRNKNSASLAANMMKFLRCLWGLCSSSGSSSIAVA